MPTIDQTQQQPPLLSGPELAQLIVAKHPFPIANAYQALNQADSPAAEFGCLLVLFETLVHYLASVAVSAYLRTGLDNAECNRHLLSVLLRDKWSTGVLYGLFRDTVRLAGDCDGRLAYPELPGWLFNRRGKPTPLATICESFVELRNATVGHGGNRSDDYFAPLVDVNRPRLEGVLASMTWLVGSQLLRPVQVQEGKVVRADLLIGTTRLRRQVCDLPLEQADLDPQTGDVRADRESLLLVREGHRYLPLFPLAQYRVSGQAAYFLHGLDWSSQQQPCSLRKAVYLGYNIDDPQRQRHEEQPRDFAAVCLERHVARLLHAAPRQENAPPASVVVAAPGDSDLTLREVQVEQQSHLRGFVGRDDLLARLHEWIDQKTEGGYLVLLGPPGQGKSALLSRLAEEESKRGGCLLHLVKSHRNPLRFVPALISQAAGLTQTTFGSSAYQGGLDDLRDSLLKAVEAVCRKTGRCVVVLDALDELEGSGGRLEFLPPRLPAGVRVVLSCRPDIPLVNALRTRLRGSLQEWPVPPLSVQDFRCLVERRLEAGVVRTLAAQVDFDELFERMGGNSLCLCCFVDDLASRWTESQRSGRPLQLDLARVPTTLEAVFRDIYDRVRQKVDGRVSPEGKQRSRMLQLLCLAREPLMVEQLCELMGVWGEALFLEDGQDRLEEMSQWLLEPTSGRFKPWHQGLADHVLLRVLGEAGTRQMEEVFCRWLADGGRGCRYHGLKHRLSHLLAARRLEDAVALLLDWHWLEAKVESGLVFELAADFTRLLAVLPPEHARHRMLALLEEALRRDIHFLQRRPAALFQCLWNSGWWYDCPQAAAHYVEGRSPGQQAGVGLHGWLERWRAEKQQTAPGFVWLRSVRPPAVHLGTAQKAVFRGHEDAVRSVAYSPDGLWVVSGSDDKTVRVWDVSSGQELLCLRGHNQQVWSVAFSPDGSRIVCGSGNNLVLWDSHSGQELLCLRTRAGKVESVACSPDGVHVASGSADRTVRVWKIMTGQELLCLRGHEHTVESVAYSPDGLWVVSGARDKTVRVWDSSSGQELLCLRGHEGSVWSVTCSPDGSRIISGAGDGTVRVWDSHDGRELLCLRGHSLWVRAVTCSPDGSQIVSGSEDKTVRIWDSSTGRELLRLYGHDCRVHSVSYSPTGPQIVSGARDTTVRVWHATSGQEPLLLHGHQNTMRSIAYSPDGLRIVSAARDKTVRVWDSHTGQELLCLRGHEGPVWSALYSPDGSRIVSGAHDLTLRIWDSHSGQELHCLRGHEDQPRGVSWSPDGLWIVSGARDKTVRVWDSHSGQELHCLRGHEGSVWSVGYSPDGLRIVSGARDKTVRVWDSHSGQELLCLRGHESEVWGAWYSQDGLRIISGSDDQTVRFWDAISGACLEVRSGREAEVALAERTGHFPLLVSNREQETVVEDVERGEPLAWLPLWRGSFLMHPSGRTWSNCVSAYLCLFTLEGSPQQFARNRHTDAGP